MSKRKKSVELIIANKELAYQHKESAKRTVELIIANKELAYQHEENAKRAVKLIVANKELEKAKEHLKEYAKGLEEMIFMVSHKVRQPVTNILGLSNLLDNSINSPEELMKLVDYMKQSALTLDTFTAEMAILLYEQKNFQMK